MGRDLLLEDDESKLLQDGKITVVKEILKLFPDLTGDSSYETGSKQRLHNQLKLVDLVLGSVEWCNSSNLGKHLKVVAELAQALQKVVDEDGLLKGMHILMRSLWQLEYSPKRAIAEREGKIIKESSPGRVKVSQALASLSNLKSEGQTYLDLFAKENFVFFNKLKDHWGDAVRNAKGISIKEALESTRTFEREIARLKRRIQEDLDNRKLSKSSPVTPARALENGKVEEEVNRSQEVQPILPEEQADTEQQQSTVPALQARVVQIIDSLQEGVFKEWEKYREQIADAISRDDFGLAFNEVSESPPLESIRSSKAEDPVLHVFSEWVEAVVVELDKVFLRLPDLDSKKKQFKGRTTNLLKQLPASHGNPDATSPSAASTDIDRLSLPGGDDLASVRSGASGSNGDTSSISTTLPGAAFVTGAGSASFVRRWRSKLWEQ